jgi:hypothetical protein
MFYLGAKKDGVHEGLVHTVEATWEKGFWRLYGTIFREFRSSGSFVESFVEFS